MRNAVEGFQLKFSAVFGKNALHLAPDSGPADILIG